jgi:hypothetical protein
VRQLPELKLVVQSDLQHAKRKNYKKLNKTKKITDQETYRFLEAWLSYQQHAQLGPNKKYECHFFFHFITIEHTDGMIPSGNS